MIAFQPRGIKGLEVGLSGQIGTVVISDENSGGIATKTEVDQRITALHLAWPGEQTELIAEAFIWDHDAAGVTSGATAWFVQAGGRVGGSMLYMRYETLDADRDTYFDSLGFTGAFGTGTARQHTVGTFGLRFDLHYSSALKIEFGQVDDDADGTYDTATAQWSFSF